jgi:hypothetical protein
MGDDAFRDSAKAFGDALNDLHKMPWPHDWPAHVLYRLATFVAFADVAFLDGVAEKEGDTYTGQIVVISTHGTLVRVALDHTNVYAQQDASTCTVSVEPLRGRVRSLVVDELDTAWESGWFGPRTLTITMDDDSSLELPISPRGQRRDFIQKIMTATGLAQHAAPAE